MIKKGENPKRPLEEGETIGRTIGCRHSNSDNCSKNSTPGICAFVQGNNTCLSPPASWKKLFRELSQQMPR